MASWRRVSSCLMFAGHSFAHEETALIWDTTVAVTKNRDFIQICMIFIRKCVGARRVDRNKDLITVHL